MTHWTNERWWSCVIYSSICHIYEAYTAYDRLFFRKSHIYWECIMCIHATDSHTKYVLQNMMIKTNLAIKIRIRNSNKNVWTQILLGKNTFEKTRTESVNIFFFILFFQRVQLVSNVFWIGTWLWFCIELHITALDHTYDTNEDLRTE